MSPFTLLCSPPHRYLQNFPSSQTDALSSPQPRPPLSTSRFCEANDPGASCKICPGPALSTGRWVLRAHPRRSLSHASFPVEAHHVPLQALTAQARGAPDGARRARSRKSCREPTLRGTRGVTRCGRVPSSPQASPSSFHTQWPQPCPSASSLPDGADG